MEQILEAVRAFDGVLELAPAEGSDFPEIAWGDHFFYYAQDGQIPERVQPYATIVTKDYPGDTTSALTASDRWRLNIHVGSVLFAELTGEEAKTRTTSADFSAADVVLPHPVYRSAGWIAIVNPGERTTPVAIGLLGRAHETARRRAIGNAARTEPGDSADR